MILAIEELHHVALQVADVAESVIFYEKVLGFVQLPRPSFIFPGAWFKLGGQQELHLIGGREVPVVSSNHGNHFALRVQDITATATYLKDQSVTLLGPKQRADGAWQIFIQDPDGHTIEFCQV